MPGHPTNLVNSRARIIVGLGPTVLRLVQKVVVWTFFLSSIRRWPNINLNIVLKGHKIQNNQPTFLVFFKKLNLYYCNHTRASLSHTFFCNSRGIASKQAKGRRRIETHDTQQQICTQKVQRKKTIAILTGRGNGLCRLYQRKLLLVSVIIVTFSVKVSDLSRS